MRRVKVRLVEALASRRSANCCSLCHNWYEPYSARALVYVDQEEMGNVCRDCLRAGPQGAAERMQAWAARLRTTAEEFRSQAEGADTLARDIDVLAQDVAQIPKDRWPNGEAPEQAESPSPASQRELSGRERKARMAPPPADRHGSGRGRRNGAGAGRQVPLRIAGGATKEDRPARRVAKWRRDWES